MPLVLPEGEIELRVEYVAPLFAHLRVSEIMLESFMRMVSQRAKRAGLPMNTSGRLWAARIERGQCVIPRWLVEQSCAALGLPVAEVMGDEWVKRFGEDGRGGDEFAPTGDPHIKRVYQLKRRAAIEDEEGDDHAA